MTADEEGGPPGGGVLDILDAMAAHVIEVRAHLKALGPDRDRILRPLCDCLLMEIGRCIAVELPPSAMAFDLP